MSAVRMHALRSPEPSPLVVSLMLAGVAIAGLAIARMPALALAAVLLIAFVGVTIAYTEAATLCVIFLIFANIPAIAVTEYGAPRSAAAAVPLLLAVPLGAYLSRGRRMIFTPVFVMLLALFLVGVASTIASEHQDVASEKLLTFGIEGVLLLLLVVNVVRTPALLRQAMWVILAAGAFLAAMTVYQKLAVGFYRPLGGFGKVDPSYLAGKVDVPRAAGPLGDPNYYAQILIVATTIGLVLIRTELSGLLRLVAGGATLLAGYAMLLTYSRGAGVAIAAVVLLMFAMRLYTPRHVVVIALGFAVLLTAMPEYRDRLANLASLKSATAEAGTDPEAEISARSRTTEMLAAALVFADHPVLGVGPDAFPRYYQQYANQIGLEVRDTALFGERAGLEAERQSHNMFLSMAADLGLPGLLLFCGIIAGTLSGLRRARRWALRAGRRDIAQVTAGMLLAVTAYVICGMFLTLAFERYFWLLLGLGGAAVAIARRQAAADEDARIQTHGARAAEAAGYRHPMALERRHSRFARPLAEPSFRLERFAWITPDRLEVSGTFTGLPETAATPAVLTLAGADATYRLPAVPDSLRAEPREGRPWSAEFQWQEPPAAFDVARLELGTELLVELPAPGARRDRSRADVLPVRRRPRPVPVGAAFAADAGAASELHGRDEHPGPSLERFREQLASVEHVAMAALAAKEQALEDLRRELLDAREAIDTRDAALAEAEAEVEQLRAELEGAREQAARARAEELESARGTVDAAREEAQRVLNRLATISETLDHGERRGGDDRPPAD